MKRLEDLDLGGGGQPSEKDALDFLRRLTGKGLPDNHVIAEGTQVSTPAPERDGPPAEKAGILAIVTDTDSAAVERDVAAAMTTIKGIFAELAKRNDKTSAAVTNSIDRPGRDKIAYATFTWDGRMSVLLEKWDTSWSIADTAGLLLDIGLNVKGQRGGGRGSLMNETLSGSRAKSGTVDTNSDWVTEFLPEGTDVKAGASATTAQLLRMLEEMDIPLPQVEAILNGVVAFWDGWKKQASGQFHTAAEVWAVYNEHLEQRLSAQWDANKV